MFKLIARLFPQGTFRPNEIELQTKIYLLAIIFVVSPFAIVSGAILRFSQNEYGQAYIDLLVLLLPLIGLYALIKDKNNYFFLSKLYVLVTFIVVSIGLFYTSIHPLSFPLLMLTILSTFIFLEGKERIYWSLAFFMILIAAYLFLKVDLSLKIFSGFIAVSLILIFMLRAMEIINKSDKEYRIEVASDKRNELLGKMILMIAHQWRQPLAAMGATIGKLKLSIALESSSCLDMDESLSKIENDIQGLSQTIRTFSDIFKTERITEPLDIAQLVLQCSDKVKIKDENIDLEVINHLNEPTIIKVNHAEYMYAINLLLDNVYDQFISQDKKHLSLTLRRDEEKVYLEIYNSGELIHLDDFEELFDPYVSSKDAKNGVGLGLFLARSLLRKNHTDIEIKNSETGVTVILSYTFLKK